MVDQVVLAGLRRSLLLAAAERVRFARHLLLALCREPANVGARAEELAGSREHDHAYIRIGTGAVEGLVVARAQRVVPAQYGQVQGLSGPAGAAWPHDRGERLEYWRL